MTFRRRALLASGLAPALASPAWAFPDRPVRLVLGFPAGTGPDVVARLLADALRDAWPAGAVVDNRPGAAGHSAAQEVARAPADGHTLLLGEIGQLAMAPSTYARLIYDPARDFAPIAEVAAIEFAFVVPTGTPGVVPTGTPGVVPAGTPIEDMAGFVAGARTRPQTFLATFGAGTPGHFGAAMLASAAGFPMEPVHFRSTGEAMTAVLGGQVQGMFGTTALVAPHVAAGRVKALMTTGPARAAQLPAVPTAAELGLPRLGFEAWFGLVAPAAVPEAAQAALEAAVLRALAVPAVRTRLQEAGFRVAAQGRAGFGTMMREETARWAAVVRETGFRALE